jgi:L-threonylcarbamoyladenylate synthase
METLLTESVEEAAAVIRLGGLVAFPTETVYGLGANVFNAHAVASIFNAKMRPADNPLIVHISDLEQISMLAAEIPASAQKFIEAFFPGPLTILFPRSAAVSDTVTAGLGSVGIRMPRLQLAADFLRLCEVPVAAPSANLSGRPSPTTWEAVREDLEGRIDCILKGDDTEIGLESTVVDCTAQVPVMLRKGAVSLEELQSVVPETQNYEGISSEKTGSPGILHRHYSPRAHVVVVEPGAVVPVSERSSFIGSSKPPGDFETLRICRSTEDYAKQAFEFFRACDRLGIKTIYCEAVDEKGIGAALMDRLRRAAEE